mmetsp:Transcript_16524/g.35616  ORF Transcript_16524/g.35616 Transcript_16524/m.35616 type:complete len:615 (-) Transcript_16524:268-2112(-)
MLQSLPTSVSATTSIAQVLEQRRKSHTDVVRRRSSREASLTSKGAASVPATPPYVVDEERLVALKESMVTEVSASISKHLSAINSKLDGLAETVGQLRPPKSVWHADSPQGSALTGHGVPALELTGELTSSYVEPAVGDRGGHWNEGAIATLNRCRSPRSATPTDLLEGMSAKPTSLSSFQVRGSWRSARGSDRSSGKFGAIALSLNRVRQRSAWQKLVWDFLESPETVPGGFTCMRILSLAIVITATFPVLLTIKRTPFDASTISTIEMTCDIIFSLEIFLRFWTCPNRLAYCLNIYTAIDLSAGILAAVVRPSGHIVEVDERGDKLFVTLICTVPVLRLLKLLRRFDTFHLILKAFRMTSEALPVLLFILSILVLVFASALYIAEPRDNIESLPIALWFTIVTVGTVGYGDVTPVTSEGTVVVCALIITSALYMAIPIGIVGKAFSTVWDDRDRLLIMHRTRTRFLECGYHAADIPTMFCSFDKDNDGELSLQEFLEMMEMLQLNFESERLVSLFCAFDYNDSGSIDDQEFVRTLFPEAFAEIYARPADYTSGGQMESEEVPTRAISDPSLGSLKDSAGSIPLSTVVEEAPTATLFSDENLLNNKKLTAVIL